MTAGSKLREGLGGGLIPGTLLAGRGLTSRIRALAGKWSGAAIAVRYRPQPWADGARPSLWQRYVWLLTAHGRLARRLLAPVSGPRRRLAPA
jgi:hypothetical protein